MKKFIAATLSIAVAIGPASALDVGLGGQVGGIGVGAGLGADSNGASAGGGTSVDNVGGADVGASLGPSDAASDNAGDESGQSAGAGSNVSSSSSAAAPSAASKGGLAGPELAGRSVGTKTATVDPTRGVRHSIALPPILWPSRVGSNKSGQDMLGYPLRSRAPLEAIPGTPNAVVRVCRQAIVSAAERFGAVRVHAVSAGPLRPERRGILTAPIQVRIDYDRQGGIEVRQARVRCRLDAAGGVIAVT